MLGQFARPQAGRTGAVDLLAGQRYDPLDDVRPSPVITVERDEVPALRVVAASGIEGHLVAGDGFRRQAT